MCPQETKSVNVCMLVCLGGESDLKGASAGVTAGPAGDLQDDTRVGGRREQVNSDGGAEGSPH
jgi:hypothetical protein